MATSYAANKNSDYDDPTMFTPNGVPVTTDDIDLVSYECTIPAAYAAACESITGGAGSKLIVTDDGSLTLDDTVNIDLSCETVEMNGTIAKRGLITVAGSGEPTNKIPAAMTNLDIEYGSILKMAALLKASSLTLTDSEYWFYVGTEPEEEDVAGTWAIIRSLIASYDGENWYVKPSGGDISISYSLLVNCLPSIYSTNHYIIFYQMPWLLTPAPPKKLAAEAAFQGGAGQYSETTGYESAKVIGEGRVSYDDLTLWDHPLDHRIFVAMMNELLADQDEYPAFTWGGGHFPISELTEFDPDQEPGEGDEVASRIYRFVVKDRPYN